MRYSERDLRAVDMLAMVLAGFGLAAMALGLMLARPRWTFGGTLLATLGFILNAKLRRIVRNGGYEDAITVKTLPTAVGDFDR